MKLAVKSLLSLLDVGTGFCYWLLGRDLLEDEIKRIEELFIRVQKPDDECDLIDELNSLAPGKDLLLVCDRQNHNLVQWCVLNKYTQALLVLLEYGCNPSRTGVSGCDLPLALACCLGQIEMIQLLLDYGANPSESTTLSADILKYLSQETDHERYLKLIDLLKYRTCVTSLSIVLTFDDLAVFHLLTGETIRSLSVSGSSDSSLSSVNITQTIDDSNMKISDVDFDTFREKLKIENYAENILPNETDECMEQQQQQQNVINHDDLSDYGDHGHFFSFCDTLDAESAAVNHDDGIQALSEKDNQAERIHEEEALIPGATTDGGYYTVDGSSGRVKTQPLRTAPVERQQLREIRIEENISSLCPTDIEQVVDRRQRSEVLSRTKSQQQLTKLVSPAHTAHRHSSFATVNIYDHASDQPSKRLRSTSSFLLSNMSSSTKHTAHLLRLLHQMIEREAATILEYFLRRHLDEFNDHFHKAASSSDIQLKTYELLSNIKSDRIYNVLLSSNCAYFNTVTTSLCDRENNTLVHSLLGQNPLKYQPTEMIRMVERYMACGLKEFINRPNLSNHCMIQILLCNEHFLKMIFFPRSLQSSSKYVSLNNEPSTTLLPTYDREIVDKWRQSYLILIEILIKHGARIDIPTGSYRNSLDCLLSSLIDLSKRLSSITTTFDVKYLKRLILILLSSFNQSKTRSIYFKYNIERLIHLLYSIHINNDDLSDILSIIHLLLQYEHQPLKLNTNTLMHLFKLWLTDPNLLCPSLIGKDLFMQQFLTIIVRRIGLTSQINDNPLLLPSTSTLPWKSPVALSDTDVSLQNLFPMLLNLISASPTCLQIHSLYELILIFLQHTTIDIINNDLVQLPIVYLCSQMKLTNHCLLMPFIDLFTMIHSSAMINKTKETLAQIPVKRLSMDLYKYFLSIEKSNVSVRSLRYISTKHLYHHLQKPFLDTVNQLPIGDALKQRLIHFHDI